MPVAAAATAPSIFWLRCGKSLDALLFDAPLVNCDESFVFLIEYFNTQI